MPENDFVAGMIAGQIKVPAGKIAVLNKLIEGGARASP